MSGRSDLKPTGEHDIEKTPASAQESRGVLGIIVVAVILVGLVIALILSLSRSPGPGDPSGTDGPSGTQTSSDDRYAFFDQGADTAEEEENRARLAEYQLSLALYLNSQGVLMANHSDPILGDWTSEAGEFAFHDGLFAWYEGSAREGNRFEGAYVWWPGCMVESGLSLTSGHGNPCYSIMMRYMVTVADGVELDTIFYGAFQVSQVDDTTVTVRNQRTGTTFDLRSL